jgi:hypothetical protein
MPLTQQEYYDCDYNNDLCETQLVKPKSSSQCDCGLLTKSSENTSDPTNISLCIYSSTSYDKAYRKVNNNCKVNCYTIGYEKISEFYEIIVNKIKSENENYLDLIRDLSKVKQQNVMIYFECCSYLSTNEYHFPEKCIKLIEYFVMNQKNLVLCADFSLKTLINDWDTEVFGRNPMIKYENIEEQKLEIEFEKNKFANSGLKQLEIMSELVDKNESKGKMILNVLNETISFKLNNITDEKYNIDVLSVVKSKSSDIDEQRPLKRKKLSSESELVVDEFIGQAVINFIDGGKIFISNGHFSELCNINYTDDTLLSSIEKTLGKEYYDDFLSNLKNKETKEEIEQLKSESIALLTTQTLSQVDD